MCLADIEINRAIRSVVYHDANGTLQIPADPQRISIRVSCATNKSLLLVALANTADSSAVVEVPLATGGAMSDALGTDNIQFPTLTFKDIGSLLKGPMKLSNLVDGDVYAICNVLPILTPYSNDPTKLTKTDSAWNK